MTTETARIVVAEDHTLLAEAYSHILQPLGQVVARVHEGDALVEAVLEWKPDLVLTDIAMPGTNGIDAIRRLRELGIELPIVVVTVHDERAILRAAFDAGARGYVLKSAASHELLNAARSVLTGGTHVSPAFAFASETKDPNNNDHAAWSPLEHLTAREREVLTLVATGATAKVIALHLGISERTAIFHKDRIKQRLGVRSIMEAVNIFVTSRSES